MSMRKFNTVVLPLLLVVGVSVSLLIDRTPRVTYAPPDGNRNAGQPVFTETPVPVAGYDLQVVRAYQNRQSTVQVHGAAAVSRILPDDNVGSRHQRFILQLSSGKTLLIAHNIDLAPRIPSLDVGDWIEFYGVFEWNEKGGVVHWTHHDPAGRHVGGWLLHNGIRYE